MKRLIPYQMRRSFRTIRRKLSQARDRASSFVRSPSLYSGNPSISRTISINESTTLSDSDDDTVFEPAEELESSTEDVRQEPITYIPCEFCHNLQPDHRLDRHQNGCARNSNNRRRRNLSPNAIPRRPHRRRTVSDSAAAAVPSAPPRSRSPSPPSRSPSPTLGYPVPCSLKCPITHAIFRDPVVASDGHTYERDAILGWLRSQPKQESPVTREPISKDKLNPNRLIKDMVDNFIGECQEKRLRYKYKLDTHLKKTELEPFIKTGTKSIYHAEWIKNPPSTTSSTIVLIHLTGEHAEKISDIYYGLTPHSNIAPILGRVEHQDSGTILVQEYSPTQTLSHLISHINEKLTVAILDVLIYQIASAFQHLEEANIDHREISADDFLVYHLDDGTDRTLIKLFNIDITNEPKDLSSNATNMHAFGELVQKLYGLKVEGNEAEARERQNLFKCCLAPDSNDRPTFNYLIDILSYLIDEGKC